MSTVQEATVTLAEAVRQLGVSVEAALQLVYEGRLPAVPERTSGRLLVKRADVDKLRE